MKSKCSWRTKKSTQHQMRCNFSTTDDILFQILRVYQTSHELRSAKAEIIQSLEDAGVLNFPSNISLCLLPRNCEVLAHAFMYLPLSKLRKPCIVPSKTEFFQLSVAQMSKSLFSTENFLKVKVWTVVINSDPLRNLWYFSLSQLQYFPCFWWIIWTTGNKISEILDSSGLTWIKMCSLTLIQTKVVGSLKILISYFIHRSHWCGFKWDLN